MPALESSFVQSGITLTTPPPYSNNFAPVIGDNIIPLGTYWAIETSGSITLTGTAHSNGSVFGSLVFSGGTIGLYFVGPGTSDVGRIFSAGRAITASDNGGGATEATTIYNEGYIHSDIAEAIEFGGQFSDTITNLNLIHGSVKTGGGDDLIANSGLMYVSPSSPVGANFVVDMADGNDSLTNTGTIGNGSSGVAAIMGDGDDRLINGDGMQGYVEILGGVDMGAGNDVFENRGYVVGYVDLGAGDDVYTGQAPAHKHPIFGGAGDDTFYMTTGGGQIVEHAGDGFDRVFSSLDLVLAEGSEIEWVQAAAGAPSLTLWGNELDNFVIGGDGNDMLLGDGGNDTLNGLGGFDYLAGGAADDVYYVDSFDAVGEAVGDGFDKVFATTGYILSAGAEVEWLQASAGTTGLSLFGNEFNNVIIGGEGRDELYGGGGNDTLLGSGGDDFLAGNTDDDVYYVDSSNDFVWEELDEGFDKVFASVHCSLVQGSEVEWLQATSGANGVILGGNEFDNVIIGSNGVDFLGGGGGNDTLNGLGGFDYLAGGAGDDIYYVDEYETVIETVGEGFDKVFATTDYFLGHGVEVEWLQASVNTGLMLVGNELSNSILGGGGADVLDGGAGADHLFGSAGTDYFLFNFGEANGDTVVDFSPEDHLFFSGYGVGATLTQIGDTDAYLITPDEAHGGAAAAETIHLSGVSGLVAEDYYFYDEPSSRTGFVFEVSRGQWESPTMSIFSGVTVTTTATIFEPVLLATILSPDDERLRADLLPIPSAAPELHVVESLTTPGDVPASDQTDYAAPVNPFAVVDDLAP